MILTRNISPLKADVLQLVYYYFYVIGKKKIGEE